MIYKPSNKTDSHPVPVQSWIDAYGLDPDATFMIDDNGAEILFIFTTNSDRQDAILYPFEFLQLSDGEVVGASVHTRDDIRDLIGVLTGMLV